MLISFASDNRRKPVFQWNMGFTWEWQHAEVSYSSPSLIGLNNPAYHVYGKYPEKVNHTEYGFVLCNTSPSTFPDGTE